MQEINLFLTWVDKKFHLVLLYHLEKNLSMKRGKTKGGLYAAGRRFILINRWEII